MASKNYLAQINLAVVGTLDTVSTGFIGFNAKSDGLYLRQSGGSENRLLTISDIGVVVSNYTAWYLYDGLANGIPVNQDDYVSILPGNCMNSSGPYRDYNWVSITLNHNSYTPINQTLSGSVVPASIVVDSYGHITQVTGRSLTLANLGYTGATNANYYTHPSASVQNPDLSGAKVLASLAVNTLGHVTGLTTRALSLADITTGGLFGIATGYTQQFTVSPGYDLSFEPDNTGGNPIVNISCDPQSMTLYIGVTGVPNCALTGYSAGITGTVVATDQIRNAISKLQTQIGSLTGLSGGVAERVMFWSGANTAKSYATTYYAPLSDAGTLVTNAFATSFARVGYNGGYPLLMLSRTETVTFYPFIDFGGTSAADKLKNLSTLSLASFTYGGMVRIAVNNVTKWIPYYS